MVRETTSCHAVLLAVVPRRSTARPAVALVADGCVNGNLAGWLAGGWREDPMLREARSSGLAKGKATKTRPGPPMPASQHVSVHVCPAALEGSSSWCLMVGRRTSAFTDAEARRLTLLVNLVSLTFNQPREVGLGRMIFDSSFKLLLTDPRSAWRAGEDPGQLSTLRRELPGVIQQRWGSDPPVGPHDAVLPLADGPTWVRFYSLRDTGQHAMYVEVREISTDDAPVVGEVNDDRV